MDLNKVAELIRETAKAEILPRFRALKPGDVREKKPGDLVTIADERAEIMLTEHLPGFLPGSIVVGEEAVAADPSVLDRLNGSVPVWIIDPVDGTGNFAHGRPHFGVIVALVVEGQVNAGWIYEPFNDVMVMAEQGSGAWSGSKQLKIGGPVPLSTVQGAAYGTTRRGLLAKGVPNGELIKETGLFGDIVNQYSGATEYISLVEGRLHFSLHSRSFPWDHAAGVLITQEAGGVARFLDGGAYDARVIDKYVLAAANEPIFDAVQATVLGSYSAAEKG